MSTKRKIYSKKILVNSNVSLNIISFLIIFLISSLNDAIAGELIGWGEDYSYRYSEVPEGSDFMDVSVWGDYGLALKSDGSIMGWGYDVDFPTPSSDSNDFVAVATNSFHALALKSDGSIVGWSNKCCSFLVDEIPAGADFDTIAAGTYHALALKSDGSIVGWGLNDYGQIDVPSGNDFIAIAAGSIYSLALKSDNSLIGWGDNSYGQINVPAGNDFSAISAGTYHALALKLDGSIVGWGDNNYGQINVPSGNDFIAISAGKDYCLALKSDGSIIGWGNNQVGQASPPQGYDYFKIFAGSGSSIAIFHTPLYVNDDATGNNDGSSWQNAFNHLQDALSAASSGDQIWVAKGIYTPDKNTLNPEGTGDRNASFELKDGVVIYGGFEGWEKRIFLADPEMHETILSGDIGVSEDNTDNSYHVVRATNVNSTAVLDGFTITGGNANEGSSTDAWGGGLLNDTSSPTINNCIFISNDASINGGGMYNYNGSDPTVNNCIFSDNYAWNGGGMCNTSNSNPSVVKCTFINNTAINGGGMNNYTLGTIRIINSTFISNTATNGAGLYNRTVILEATNCLFNGNSSGTGGGFYNYDSVSDVINCTFFGNSATDKGGGLYTTNNSVLTLANGIAWGNTSPMGPQISLAANSTVSASYCNVQSGQTAVYNDGTGTINWTPGNIDADPIFVDAGEGDLRLSYGSPCTDAGNNGTVPEDVFDLDEDGSITEPVPWDLEENSRMIDEIFADPNASIVDMGAYERRVHLYVDDASDPLEDGTPAHPYDTVQEAVDSSQDEYVIVLQPGTYTGTGNRDITFDGKAITVQSTDPTDSNVVIDTVIDCQGTELDPHRGFNISSSEGPKSIIDGITITNGYLNYDSGAAIFCFDSGPTIRNCWIDNNFSSSDGGGIYCANSNISTIKEMTISNCVFKNNYSKELGGALSVGPSVTYEKFLAKITNCTFENNYSRDAGNDIAVLGVFKSAVINHSTFSGNSKRIIEVTGGTGSISSEQGYENMYYGYYAEPNDPGSFQNLPVYGELLDHEGFTRQAWILDPNTPPWLMEGSWGCTSAWPGGYPSGPDRPVVYRWICNTDDGTILFHGKIRRLTADPSDTNSLIASIYVDDTQVWSNQIEGQETIYFDHETYVSNGSTVDIVVSAGNYAENDEVAEVSVFFGPSVSGIGIYSYGTATELRDCTLDSSTDSICAYGKYGSLFIEGTVNLASNRLFKGYECQLQGLGTLNLEPNSVLLLSNNENITYHTPSTIACNVDGDGLIEVPLGAETVIEGNSRIELTDPNGGILCEGLLRAKDNAQIINTNVEVTRVSFEGDVDITHSTIFAEAGTPYGQFFAEDSARIEQNVIYADGDRYLDLDPAYLQNMIIANNEIHVLITEGVNNTRGGLFELRGDPNLTFPIPPDPNIYHYNLMDPNQIPDFDTQSWTLEELELLPGAKVNLTNRFDFGNGDFDEVLYVKQLVVGPDSQLNTAFNRLYYGDLIGDPNCIVNYPMLGFSLNMIECDSDPEFVHRVVHNNYVDPENSAYDRIHVDRVAGEPPDPNGMIKMTSLPDEKPGSPTEGQLINARAKGLFSKSDEQQILIWFEYLFNDPNTELEIYLSDVPELLAHDHPDRHDHYVKVTTLKCPPSGRPGSPGSARFGTFHQYVDRKSLNFIRGTRVELEFIGSDGESIYIDNWDPYVNCQGNSVCKDTNESTAVDSRDFLTVIGECGSSAADELSRECLEGPFCQNGYVDAGDIVSWDWITNLKYSSSPPTDLCFTNDIPLVGSAKSAALTSQTNPLPLVLGSLLITGKKDSVFDFVKMQDSLYAFNGTSFIDVSLQSPTQYRCRLNGKLITDNQGAIYQLNAEHGLVRLSEPNAVIIPTNPNGLAYVNEPRYSDNATVYLGLYGSGDQWAGRPILDVAFDPGFDSNSCTGLVYVVPVVVQPNTMDPNYVYTAAAKLMVYDPNNYDVVEIYDDPPLPDDNQSRNSLREIEVDHFGNVYVVNSDERNESDILWKFPVNSNDPNIRVDLGYVDTNPYIPGPIAMHVSSSTNRLYLASSQYSTPDPTNSQVYGLKLSDLTLDRTITINDMHHITDITEDPITDDLWISGFNYNDNLPSEVEVPSADSSPFYEPYLAQVPPDQNSVTADPLVNSDPNYDLALPLSIIWTEVSSCGGADIAPPPDGDGIVNIEDFVIFAEEWLSSNCNQGNNWCEGADLNQENPVDLLDWRIFADHWLINCN